MKVSISAKTVLLKIVMIFIIPFFLFLMICFGYGYVDSYYNRSMSNRSELKMYQSFLEDEMQKISFFMSDIAANNTAFSCFRYPQSSLDEHLNKYFLMEKFESIMKIDQRIDMMGIISTEYNVYGTNYRRGISYDKKEHIDNYIRKMAALNKDDEIGRWEICKIDGTNYFLQIMGSRGVYCFCLVSLASASRKLDTGHGWRYITFADENGFLLYEEEMEAMRLRWKPEESYLGGRYFQQLVTGSSSGIMGCNMVLIDSMWSVWTAKSVPLIVSCFALLFFLILMKCYRMVKSRFLLPLGVMVETMDRIASGKLESTLVVGSDIEEYKKVETAFNDMIRQVGDLKILAYDRMIQVQKTQLQYYQIQIRPHFFLNCMKNLYAMTDDKDYEQIKETILELSDYLRYVFKNHDMTIPLHEEMESVKAYVRLQQSQFAKSQYKEDVDEKFRDFQIPPMSILTFVENSFRHARTYGKIFQIYIKVRMISGEGEDYINITIRDNGAGFPKEVLDRLCHEAEQPYGEQIGIYNVRERFRLLYGTGCSFVFSNMNGANVDIFIPLKNTDLT